jgi:hypothetical protein
MGVKNAVIGRWALDAPVELERPIPASAVARWQLQNTSRIVAMQRRNHPERRSTETRRYLAGVAIDYIRPDVPPL